MAFVKSQLTRVNVNPTGNEAGYWVYITQDLPSVVASNGYFPVSSEIKAGETISVSGYDATEKRRLMCRKMYRVNSVDFANDRVVIQMSDVNAMNFRTTT